MKIELDTNNLSDLDRAILALINGQTLTIQKVEPEQPATPVKAPAKKAPVKAEPVEEPEVPTSEPDGDTGEGENLIAPDDPAEPADPSGRSRSDAVAAATQLVSNGQSAKVKAALAEVGAKRVSEIADDQIEQFFAALEQ